MALTVVNLVGGHKPRRLVLGFMLAGALLSMWISNTASALMLMPVALAVWLPAQTGGNWLAPLSAGSGLVLQHWGFGNANRHTAQPHFYAGLRRKYGPDDQLQ